MTKEIIWKTFEKTGDLNAYLLFKEVENIEINIKPEENQEDTPKMTS